MKSTVSGVFEDLKFNISKCYKQNWNLSLSLYCFFFLFYQSIVLDKTSYPVGMEPAAIASLFGRNSKLAEGRSTSACAAHSAHAVKHLL